MRQLVCLVGVTGIWAGALAGPAEGTIGEVPGSPQNLSAASQDARDAQMASDFRDRSTIVWSRSDGSNTRIQSVRLGADGAAEAVQTLSVAGQNARNPAIAYDPGSGSMTVLWELFDGSNSRIQTIQLGFDGSPGTVRTLSAAGQDAEGPALAIDTRRRATVTWTRFDGSDYRIQSVRLAGDGSPEAVRTLSAGGRSAFKPAVVIDADDRATVAWERSDGSRRRIQSVRLAPNGSPGSVQTHSEAGQDARDPAIAIDHSDRATIVWHRFDGTANRIQSVRLASDETPGQVLDLSAAGASAFDPQLVVDAANRTMVVWRRSDGTNDRVQSVRLGANGSAGSVQTLSQAGGSARLPQVDVDSDNRATVAWQRSDGTNDRVQSVRLGADGTPEQIKTLSAAGQGAGNAQLIVDNVGRGTVAWQRSDGTSLRIQSTRTFEIVSPDNFADRLTVGPTLPVVVPGTLNGATAEDHEFPSQQSVWFEFTPTASQRVTLDVCAGRNAANKQVKAFTGEVTYALEEASTSTGRICQSTLDATAGVAYKIQVFEFTDGDFVLKIRPTPPNDEKADAQVVGPALPIQESGTTIGATFRQGEPIERADRGSVWYSYTPSADATVTIEACDFVGPAQVVVYTGSPATVVAGGGIGGSGPCLVELAATAGTTYQITVQGANSDFTLGISIVPPPNDNFADAIPLPLSLPHSATGTNVEATAEVGEPAHIHPASSSVWYSITPSEHRTLTFDTCQSTFDTVMAIYTGPTLADLTRAAGSDDGDQCAAGGNSAGSRASLTPIPGTRYWIAIDRFSSGFSTGDFTLTVSDQTAPDEVRLHSTIPRSPSSNNDPAVTGTAEAGSTVRLFTDSDCTSAAGVAATASAFQDPGIMVNVPSNASTNFWATATDDFGNTSACTSDSLTYVEDSDAPEPPELTDTVPTSPSSEETAPLVQGNGPEDAVEIKVFLRRDCFGPSTDNTRQLLEGAGIQVFLEPNTITHLGARAVDEAGNESECSNSIKYRHDNLPPQPPSVSGVIQGQRANDNSPTVYGFGENGSMIQLYTDEDCTSATGTATPEADFNHPGGITVAVDDNSTTTFWGTATDDLGHTSECSTISASYSEVSPAVPTFTAVTPDSPANHNEPTITGSASPGDRVQLFEDPGCLDEISEQVSAAEFASAGITIQVEDNSVTKIHAAAVDFGVWSDCSEDPITFVEDSKDPGLSISSPEQDESVATTDVEVRFQSPEEGAFFECKLDSRPVSACSDPTTFPGLGEGAHAVEVTAIDRAGNTTTESRAFVVDTIAPTASISLPAQNAKIASSSVEFRFGSDDPEAKFQCRLGAVPLSPCSSPARYSDLADGAHAFVVRAIDRAGNQSAAAVRNFTITLQRCAVARTDLTEAEDAKALAKKKLRRAKKKLRKAKSSGDRSSIRSAKKKVRRAKRRLSRAKQTLSEAEAEVAAAC